MLLVFAFFIGVLLLVLYLIVIVFKPPASIASYMERRGIVLSTENNSLLSASSERVSCEEQQIFCTSDADCAGLCKPHSSSSTFSSNYRCMPQENTCLAAPTIDGPENYECSADKGFYPALVVDEILGAKWTCLNTLPYLFNDTENFHRYICAGGKLVYKNNPGSVFADCECDAPRIKVIDEFRGNIPICIDQYYLPLFANFRKNVPTL